jgi:hypothetical protein
MNNELNPNNPDTIPTGQFTKFTLMRIETGNFALNEYVSAVNGTITGEEAKFGILTCDFNNQLKDCPVAIYQQGSVQWFSNINNAAPVIMKKIKNKLALSKQEEAIVKGLIMDEDYEDLIPDHWQWRFGNEYSGEIKIDRNFNLVGKLAINTAVYWDHRIIVDDQDEYGVSLNDGSGIETPDDDCELVAIG